MDQGQMRYQLELLAFFEKTALAQLEVSRAALRVDELKFEKARYMLDAFRQAMAEDLKPVQN